MPSFHSHRRFRSTSALCLAGLLLAGAACTSKPATGGAATTRRATVVAPIVNVQGTPIALTAARMTVPLRDGTPSPMWGFCASASCTGSWSPGPTIYANAGDTLTINLTNALPVPTSLVVLGQLGGGVGTPTMMASPPHTGQSYTTFPNNVAASTAFTPPAQGARVRSFGTEVPAAVTSTTGTTTTTTTLTFAGLKPGTYLYETGTMPSLQVPMGLYGTLVVTANTGSCVAQPTLACSSNTQCQTTAFPADTCSLATTNVAYPGLSFDDQTALLFSEMDPVQNAAVDNAAVHATDPSLRFNDPTCSPNCYPAAVNYAPTYFFINGQAFDKTAPQSSAWQVANATSVAYGTGNVLVRLANAGSRTHVPSIVGLPMSIVAEDGNVAPGNAKVENEVLLTAGKTHDVMVRPLGSATAGYTPNTFGVLDRALNLSTANHPDGGMMGFLLVNHAGAATTTLTTGTCSVGGAACSTTSACTNASTCIYATAPVAGAPGNLPAAVVPTAVNDSFNVPCNATFGGDVTVNDVGVTSTALVSSASKGALTLHADGTFTYVPAGCAGGTDGFSYNGNGGTTNTATVTLNLGTLGGAPTANPDSYRSPVAIQLAVPRPGVLGNDTDPSGFPLSAGSAVAGAGCASVTLNPDGSFSATGAGSTTNAPYTCTFTYVATNSQGTPSAPATATIQFGAASNLAVAATDAVTGAAIADYRWTIQQDLTFKHATSGTPSVSTRTVATSFHRSHMPVVATGCVGPISCGQGQSVRVDNGAIASVSAAGTLVTVTTSVAQPLPAPTQVTVSGVQPSGYDGTFTATWVNGTTFTYTVPTALGPATLSSSGGTYALNGTLGGRHVVTAAEALAKQVLPSQVTLDPTQHYFITLLPGDAANGFMGGNGHAIGGGEIKYVAATATTPAAWTASVKMEQSPLVGAQMSVYIYEDDEPTNGQDEPTESPLGGFEVVLFDPAGRTGDPAGQNTYDIFNMPLSNYLLGRPGCPDTLNATTNAGASTAGTCSITTTQACSATLPCPGNETCIPAGNPVGVIYTCPNPSPAELAAATTPAAIAALNAKYALAGHALVKNVVPARYDVLAHPGAAREAAGESWWQTETLEGTQAQDAFVGVNEPVYFQEFGPPGPHVTIGFVNPDHVAARAKQLGLSGTATITGRVTNQHMSHPSDVSLWDSGSNDMFSATTCRVVLNTQAGTGPAVAAATCDPQGNFTLTGIAPGAYDVAVFDEWLDQIIQNVPVTVPAGTITATTTCGANTVCMGDIQTLGWFTQWDQNIFQDDGTGLYTPDKGIRNVPLTVRFRNGAPSNIPFTDSTGNAILPELFPLFNWYVAEADTTRFKQTRVNITVDGGGKVDTAGAGAGLWTSTYASGGTTVRTETPGALSYGLQGFISQRSRIEWGRTPYAVGENGGIMGTVVFASTRPFDDQRFDVQNIWEPLVPRVTVNLYQQVTRPDGTQALQLVDSTKTTSFDDFANTVKGADGNPYLMGTNYQDQVAPYVGLTYPDGTVVAGVDVSGTPAPQAAYPAGVQVNMQCPGQLPGTTAPPPWNMTQVDPYTSYTLGNDRYRCYDGFHDWNQVQGAPYDGRYTFPSAAYQAAHPLCSATVTTNCTTPAAGQTLVSLPTGSYVVEVVTPPGYEVVKEEDKDILIGDAFIAPVSQQFGPLASIFILPDQATIGSAQYAGNPYNPSTGDPGFQSNPTSNLGVGQSSNGISFPQCVGNLHRVPDYLSLYPAAQQVAPFAGMDRPLCDRKLVALNDQMQANANFFVFTEAPVASNNTGIILDDASSEFNAAAPDFGEKASVPFVPVSIKDFTGVELSRTYSDQWGAYNMMTASSWYVNPPTPSGYGPNMLVTCINDPGPIPDPTGALDPATGKVRLVTDPSYNPAYSNFCYTNPYMPGQTTYLDTPVLPIAAFAAGYNPADCAQPDATPNVLRVDTSAGVGPWLPSAAGTVTITAQGDVKVPNPAYLGPFASSTLTAVGSSPTITRHYGFGTTPGSVRVNGVALGCSWSDLKLTCTVPSTVTTGELVITTAAGLTSTDTVTLNIGPASVTRVSGGYAGQTGVAVPGPIQSAIDAANPGDLILVDAGTYNELVIMWKPVRLQGVGAASVIINAAKYPTGKLDYWRPRINALFNVDPVTGNQTLPSQVDPLPTQEITGGVVLLEPSVLGSEEGAGITVLAKNLPAGTCGTSGPAASNFLCAPSRIDGLSVTGGDSGGGIYVNGWAHNLEISNNRVYGNAGAFNGGIRVGVPYLETEFFPGQSLDATGNVIGTPSLTGGRITGLGYDRNVRIHHNSVTKNGTVEGAGVNGGAGAGISMCAGSDNYTVDHNWVCANFSQSDGGGVGHLGFSQGGHITNNKLLFNQSFQQTGPTHGGAILVGGEPPVAGTLSLGTGDVTIANNLIRGNFAETGHGGGIRFQQVNGADVQAFPLLPTQWHRVTVNNDMIDNNVAGWAGGGISMADTLSIAITNNRIDSNDSAGIAGVVLAGGVALPAATTGTPGNGYPSPSGVVSERTSAALLAAFPNTLAGNLLKGLNTISQPFPFSGNTLWQNRSFYYFVSPTTGASQICAGNTNPPPASCTVLANQTATGQCPSGAAYWDLGVLGDTSPAPSGSFNTELHPTASVITSTAGYPTNSTTLNVNLHEYCNGSRIVPELPSVLNPPSVKNLAVAATVDEGNNYVNLRYGPLYVENPASTTTTTFGPMSP